MKSQASVTIELTEDEAVLLQAFLRWTLTPVQMPHPPSGACPGAST